MAKKIAPPGILLNSGAYIPRKLPEKSSSGSEMEYNVLGIWRRTVAVSSGYLTRVLVVDKAAPDTKPDMISENVSLFLTVFANRFILDDDDRAVVVVFAKVGSKGFAFTGRGSDEMANKDTTDETDLEKNADLVKVPPPLSNCTDIDSFGSSTTPLDLLVYSRTRSLAIRASYG
jgi:hypothetical protein